MIGRNSRYASSILYQDGPEEFLGTRPLMDTTPRPDDCFHTVVEGDRLDNLSLRYFGRADLWWIICDYNDIFSPLELENGTILRIPALEHVQMRVLI
jgi:hypothetical protein